MQRRQLLLLLLSCKLTCMTVCSLAGAAAAAAALTLTTSWEAVHMTMQQHVLPLGRHFDCMVFCGRRQHACLK
jgi:hypothetical protein